VLFVFNKHFNRGIIGAYHITLAGTLFLETDADGVDIDHRPVGNPKRKV
jgi:hypothetical protein